MGTPRKGLFPASRGSALSSPSFLMNNFLDSSPFLHGLVLPWPPARDAGEQQEKGWENGKIPKSGLASCRDAPDHPTPSFLWDSLTS